MKTKTFLPIFKGFYNSYFEPCMDSEIEHFQLEGKNIDIYDYIDWNEYYNTLSVDINNEVESLLSHFVESITFEKLVSPKYYNFSNDSINCIIDFNPDKILNYLNTWNEELKQYLKDNYTSCDGFTSHYSNNVKDWINKDSLEHKHKCGAIFNFIAWNEGIEEISLCEIESINIVPYINEFYELEEIKNLV